MYRLRRNESSSLVSMIIWESIFHQLYLDIVQISKASRLYIFDRLQLIMLSYEKSCDRYNRFTALLQTCLFQVNCYTFIALWNLQAFFESAPASLWGPATFINENQVTLLDMTIFWRILLARKTLWTILQWQTARRSVEPSIGLSNLAVY